MSKSNKSGSAKAKPAKKKSSSSVKGTAKKAAAKRKAAPRKTARKPSAKKKAPSKTAARKSSSKSKPASKKKYSAGKKAAAKSSHKKVQSKRSAPVKIKTGRAATPMAKERTEPRKVSSRSRNNDIPNSTVALLLVLTLVLMLWSSVVFIQNIKLIKAAPSNASTNGTPDSSGNVMLTIQKPASASAQAGFTLVAPPNNTGNGTS